METPYFMNHVNLLLGIEKEEGHVVGDSSVNQELDFRNPLLTNHENLVCFNVKHEDNIFVL